MKFFSEFFESLFAGVDGRQAGLWARGIGAALLGGLAAALMNLLGQVMAWASVPESTPLVLDALIAFKAGLSAALPSVGLYFMRAPQPGQPGQVVPFPKKED